VSVSGVLFSVCVCDLLRCLPQLPDAYYRSFGLTRGSISDVKVKVSVSDLAFTRDFHYQYCMVYGIHKGWGGGSILRNRCALVLQ